MYNNDTELLFPSRVIPSLRSLRGEVWKNLVDQVESQTLDEVEHAAFALIMVRMGGCISCNADSFRAMRGCTQCAKQTVRRYRGTDPELAAQFNLACQEVRDYLKKTP